MRKLRTEKQICLYNPWVQRITAAWLLPLVLVAVSAARETHAHFSGDSAVTVVHAHFGDIAYVDHGGDYPEASSHHGHGHASYLDCLQLRSPGALKVFGAALRTPTTLSLGDESLVARVSSENSRAHAPPGQVIRSLRSPPA